MPVTFPDGTTAELVYPAELPLEEMYVTPDTYAEGGPEACGLSVAATRHDPAVRWTTGEAPLAEHVRKDGSTVELWAGRPDHAPYDFLVYRFGSWSVLVPCDDAIDKQAITTWAENLHGHESADGLLVLEGTAPLEAHPYEDRDGPTIRFSDQDIVIDITVGPVACGWDVDDRHIGADETVQWCIEPDGGIWLYATAFEPEGRGLLQELVDGLDVRSVRVSSSPPA